MANFSKKYYIYVKFSIGFIIFAFRNLILYKPK